MDTPNDTGSSGISPDQLATRRRALGRKMLSEATNLLILREEMLGLAERQYLSGTELGALDKQLSGLYLIGNNLRKLGTALEAGTQ